MSVHVDRVAASVIVVDYYFNDVIVIEDFRVSIGAIDNRVCSIFAGAQDSHKCGNVLGDICEIVDEDPGRRWHQQSSLKEY